MKQTKTKRLLSLVIAAMMILTLIPAGAFSVFAADEAPAGSGTEQDPFLIDDKATWEYISGQFATYASAGYYFKLTNNIIATNTGNETLKPLFKSSGSYNAKAHIDGDGHKVSGFKNYDYDKGFISGNKFQGSIKNLTLEGMLLYQHPDSSTGLIARYAKSCSIENLTVKDCVINFETAGRYNIGGLFGYTDYMASFTAKNVTIDGLKITASGTTGVGAFFGRIQSDSTAGTDYKHTFENCVVKNCNIKGSMQVGAFVGKYYQYVSTTTANFKNCQVINTNLEGASSVSAFVGDANGSGDETPTPIKGINIENCLVDKVSVKTNGVVADDVDGIVGESIADYVDSNTNFTVANSGLGEIAGFVEQTADGEDVRHYRFAALTTADREAYDMKVTSVYGGYNYEWVADENSALETLDVYNGLEQDMGIDADTLDGKKFIAVVIENGPMAAIEFVVSISYTDGEITWTEYRTLSFDANGECAQSVSMA